MVADVLLRARLRQAEGLGHSVSSKYGGRCIASSSVETSRGTGQLLSPGNFNGNGHTVVSNTPEVNDDRLRNPGQLWQSYCAEIGAINICKCRMATVPAEGYVSSSPNRLGEAFIKEGTELIKRKDKGDSLAASVDFQSLKNWNIEELQKKDRDAAGPISPDPNMLMSRPGLAHADG
ncbi:hypothetical protein Ancab_018983 [Ancistrocladus abbreviatus]